MGLLFDDRPRRRNSAPTRTRTARKDIPKRVTVTTEAKSSANLSRKHVAEVFPGRARFVFR